MIFYNQSPVIKEQEMSFGKLKGWSLGEKGRGRKEIFLPIPIEFEHIWPKRNSWSRFESDYQYNHLCQEMSIGQSKTGRPKVILSRDNEIFIILSSARNYTRRGNGRIQFFSGKGLQINDSPLKTPNIIARGNGADGDAGRIGNWDVIIFKAQEGDWFRIIWAGYNYGYPSTFYTILNGNVVFGELSNIEDIVGEDNIPFTIEWDEGQPFIKTGEWRQC